MSRTIRTQTLWGLTTIALLVLGIGVWGTLGSLAGAVIASGQIEPESRAQVIQHPDGGVVARIAVKDGQKVSAGDVLLTIDGTQLRADLAVIEGQLTELEARAARLRAEELGHGQVAYGDRLVGAARADAAVRAVLVAQSELFEARARTYQQTIKGTREQQAQKAAEARGLKAQEDALAEQLGLIEEELADLQGLRAKGLVGAPRVADMQRMRASLTGQRAATEASVAASLGQVAGLEVEVQRLTAVRQQEALTELNEVDTKLAQLSEERKALMARVARLDLRAPRDGIIHGQQIHALGAVIRPADPVMYVIPQDDLLTITARVDATHVDSVFAGQPAALRFPGFDARTTPELMGKVIRVSADVISDQRTGAQFYTAEVAPDPGQLDQLSGKALLPGMPVEVYIQTGSHSPLSYLLKPFLDYLARGFRE